MEKKIPIEQITENGFTHWVASSHIEENFKEPTRSQMIWGLLKDMVRDFVSKLKHNQKNEKSQFCIECGGLVDDNSSCKNCHDHCRLEL